LILDTNYLILIMNPLSKKLQIKPNSRWLLHNSPANFLDSLLPLPSDVEIAFNTTGNFNGILLFVTNSQELASELKAIAPVLNDDAVFWIIYPKKTSKIPADLEMMSSWNEPSVYGLRPVASAAINETWTALRFRPQDKVKVSEGRNDGIRNNEHSAYIDVDNKIVTLPDYIKSAIEQHSPAMAWYQQLSYSNKKEYVLWILTAKQEKTRDERLAKMIDMLLNKKKNPSDK